MYKVISFDLDDTLIDREQLMRKFFHALIKKYAANPQNIEEIINQILIWDNAGYSNRDDVNQRIIDTWELKLTGTQLTEELYATAGGFLYVEPHAKEVLYYLHKRYKLTLITNGPSVLQHNKIIGAGLETYFSDVIVSEDVGLYKPDKRIFALSCNNIGAKPNDVLYVGDHYENDIIGAVNAGLDAVLYNRKNSCAYNNHICDLRELIHFL